MGIYAEHDFIVVQAGKRAKYMIPDRKNITEIAIRVRQGVVVMHPVHIGRNNHPAQPAIQFSRETNIGVIELRQGDRQGLIQENNVNGRSGEHHSGNCKYKPENTFAWVVAIGRSRIDVRIGVMHQVKTPHPAHFMFGPVYEIGADQIEQQQARYQEQPHRHIRKPL